MSAIKSARRIFYNQSKEIIGNNVTIEEKVEESSEFEKKWKKANIFPFLAILHNHIETVQKTTIIPLEWPVSEYFISL